MPRFVLANEEARCASMSGSQSVMSSETVASEAVPAGCSDLGAALGAMGDDDDDELRTEHQGAKLAACLGTSE